MTAPARHTVDLRSALVPVRLALLDDARAEAERILAEAERDAALMIGRAEREAAAEIARARRRGVKTAEARAEQAIARARSDAYRRLLSAREHLRQQLHESLQVALDGLRADDRYPALLDELERLARDQLGPNVEIDRDPDARGGIVAVAGSRRVDYTLAALADRALEARADEVAALWS